MDSRSVLDLCEKLGIPVRSPQSSLNEAYADMVRRRASRDFLTGGPAGQPRRHVPTRSLRFLHLQQYMSINGRDALGSRQLLEQLRSEKHETKVRALVGEPSTTDPSIAEDFITPSQFLAYRPDVVTSERTLLVMGSDRLRIAEDVLGAYLSSGGVVIVDGVGVHNAAFGPTGEPLEAYGSAWKALDSFGRITFLDCQSPDHLGVRLRNDGEGLSGHPQVMAYSPKEEAHARWLAPAYRNIGQVLILDVRPLATTGDLLGSIGEPSTLKSFDMDVGPDLGGPFPWGVVRQVGFGFLVLISGIVMSDVVVDTNPDNAIFLQQLAELLVGEAEREKAIRGASAEPVVRAPKPDPESTREIRVLMQQGEGRQLEFKSSARHDMKTGEKNRALESEIARQVVAMWNTEGGDLLVGVADDGTLVGIEVDYPYVDGKSDDGWVRFIEDLLIDRAEEVVHAATPVRVTTHRLGELTVGRLSIPRGGRPAYYLAPAEQKGAKRMPSFLVRDNNRIREIDIRHLHQFIADRFPEAQPRAC